MDLFTKDEWKQALVAGEGQIKQGEMIKLQGQLLVKRAKEELKE